MLALAFASPAQAWVPNLATHTAKANETVASVCAYIAAVDGAPCTGYGVVAPSYMLVNPSQAVHRVWYRNSYGGNNKTCRNGMRTYWSSADGSWTTWWDPSYFGYPYNGSCSWVG
jgi:hypothetical protein